MSSKGYILLHRKIKTDWKWSTPLYRAAWTWMLVEAHWGEHNGLQRGQLKFSVTWAPKLWGMSVSAARAFLSRCENELDENGEKSPCIIWQRGFGGTRTKVKRKHEKKHEKSGESCGEPGVITLLNYDQYQSYIEPASGESCGESCGEKSDVLNTIRINTIRKNNAQRKSAAESRDDSRKKAEEKMLALDLGKFIDKYPHLFIKEEHEKFMNHHLSRPANYHGSRRIEDWNRAFHNWCSADWKKPKDDDTPRPATKSKHWGF